MTKALQDAKDLVAYLEKNEHTTSTTYKQLKAVVDEYEALLNEQATPEE